MRQGSAAHGSTRTDDERGEDVVSRTISFGCMATFLACGWVGRAEGMSFAHAVQHGAMVEPAVGEPEMPPLLADLNALGVPLMAIVEHDLYPAPADVPLPIATRTQQYYRSCGLTSRMRGLPA